MRVYSAPSEGSPRLLPAVKHPHDGERAGSGVIHNQIGKRRPEFDGQRRQVLANMPSLRVKGQQTETRCDFLQDLSGEAVAALACEIAPDFPDIFPALRR